MIIALIISFFYYALKRPNSIEKYLKQGLEQAVIEIETVKRIIPPVLLAGVLLNIFWTTTLKPFPTNMPQDPDPIALASVIIITPIVITSVILFYGGISSLLMYGLFILKKDSKFYFAKTCFMSALNKKDILKQMYYFSIGLQEYNRYLKRQLKLQINDINKILSKASILDDDAKNHVIRSISNSFDSEIDKLKPLKCITSELMKSEDAESILIQETFKSQLKVVSAFLAASIPIVISIVTLYMKITTGK